MTALAKLWNEKGKMGQTQRGKSHTQLSQMRVFTTEPTKGCKGNLSARVPMALHRLWQPTTTGAANYWSQQLACGHSICCAELQIPGTLTRVGVNLPLHRLPLANGDIT